MKDAILPSKNWGVVEVRDDDGNFIAYHIMPMVDCDGEAVPSNAHTLSDSCHCRPTFEVGHRECSIWNHHDPTHPGSIEMESAAVERRKRVAVTVQ